MFFKGFQLEIFSKFLWVGLIFGLFAIVLKLISKIFRKNAYLVNFLMFVFVVCFGLFFFKMCLIFNSYSFSGIGLFSMILGVLIIRISVEFFFDYFIRFIYNEFSLLKRKHKNGKLQTNKKVWKFR